MTDAMRASGDIMFQFLKTRSSDGVGKNAHLAWDAKTLRVSDSTKDNVISLKAENRSTGVLFNKNDDKPNSAPKAKQEPRISSSLIDLIESE